MQASSVPAGAAPAAECALHGGAPAAATCTRCGRFVCARCLGRAPFAASAQRECPDCRAIGAAARRERAVKRLRAERWISLAVLGAIIAVTSATVAARMLRHDVETDRGVLAIAAVLFGLIAGTPMWIASVLFAAGRRPWLGWLALTSELVGLMWWLFLLPQENRARLFALPLALYGISRTRRLRTLVGRASQTGLTGGGLASSRG